MAERKRTIGVRDDFCISLRRRTTDVQPMTKSHMKTPTMIYKAIHRKLKIEQQILGMNSCVPQKYAVSAPLVASAVLLF